MKVAVFGGTGRTGALVVQELLNDGHEVTMLVRDVAKASAFGAHISRYVGISVAGLALPGDSKRFRDKIISWLLNRLGGELAKDKIAEYEAWNRSGFDWTLVRVPRLTDGPMGDVDVDAHVSGRRTTLSRASLARFVATAVGDDSYTRMAPFVSDR
ncbi:MAG: NAD(P)-dependent oxidoreductase [Microbacterium sp.]|nr:NAD(P)-dependent oxidoreductase [Microbacterium sp.]